MSLETAIANLEQQIAHSQREIAHSLGPFHEQESLIAEYQEKNRQLFEQNQALKHEINRLKLSIQNKEKQRLLKKNIWHKKQEQRQRALQERQLPERFRQGGTIVYQELLEYLAQNRSRSQTFLGHSDKIWQVAFAPDGLTLASSSWDRTIKLWQIPSGQCLQTLTGHTSQVMGLAFAPNGNLLASASWDRSIRLWELPSGRCLQSFLGHSANLNAVSFSADSAWLASGGEDRVIILWETASGQSRYTLRGHLGTITSLSLSPSGSMLVSGSEDKTAMLWDLSSGKAFRTLKGHSGEITSLCFSGDGGLIASGSKDETIRLWEAGGRYLRVLKGHTGAVTSVSFAEDGLKLISGSTDKTLRLWDVASGQCLQVLTGHSEAVTSVSFSPEGSLVASGSADRSFRIWDLREAWVKEWTERLETASKLREWVAQKEYHRLQEAIKADPLLEHQPELQPLREEWQKTLELAQSYYHRQQYHSALQAIEPIRELGLAKTLWLTIQLYAKATTAPADATGFAQALKEYRMEASTLPEVDAWLAQAIFYHKATPEKLPAFQNSLKDWLKIQIQPQQQAECQRLLQGFKNLQAQEEIRWLEEHLQNLQTAEVSSLPPATIEVPETELMKLTLNLNSLGWEEDEIHIFFSALSQENRTLDQALGLLQWQKLIALGESSWSFSQISVLLHNQLRKMFGDMIQEHSIQVNFLTPRGSRLKTAYLISPLGQAPYDFPEVGLVLSEDAVGNAITLQMYAVFLPQPLPDEAKLAEINQKAARLAVSIRKETDSDIKNFLQNMRDQILETVEQWLKSVTST